MKGGRLLLNFNFNDIITTGFTVMSGEILRFLMGLWVKTRKKAKKIIIIKVSKKSRKK